MNIVLYFGIALTPPVIIIIAIFRLATRTSWTPQEAKEKKRAYKLVKEQMGGWLAMEQPGPTGGELSLIERLKKK
jgi:hypothetical protein